MDRRGFVRLAGMIIGIAGIGSKSVLGESHIDEAATPSNMEESSIKGNSLSSVAEPVPLEEDDIEEVTTNDEDEEITYWVVNHGYEYDRAIYREPARLGGSNFELDGSDSGSFWFGIDGEEWKSISHQGQVTLYLHVADNDDEIEEESVSSSAPGRRNNRADENEDDDTEDDDEEEGDEKDAKWVYLKAQFTAGRKDELLHVNGVKLDGDGGEDDEEDDDEGGEDEDDEEDDDEGGEDEDKEEREEDDDEDAEQDGVETTESSHPGRRRPPVADDRLPDILKRIMREL